MPSAYRGSPSSEKTAARSCSSRGRSAEFQRALSCPASAAILSQRSAVEVCNGLAGPVDLLVAVGEGDEHGLELARGHVDPAFEQVSKECAVAIRVGTLRIVEVAHGLVGHEERCHRAD